MVAFVLLPHLYKYRESIAIVNKLDFEFSADESVLRFTDAIISVCINVVSVVCGSTGPKLLKFSKNPVVYARVDAKTVVLENIEN